MATFQSALEKLLHRPIDLDPADIHALKARDPWLAKAAVTSWRRAMRWEEYQVKYQGKRPEQPTRHVVVRVDPTAARRVTRVVRLDRPKKR
jgi:hypothetical protein